MKIMISDICEAFKSKTVGSKVNKAHYADFMKALERAINKHDWSKARVKGQAVIDLPRTVNKWVSPGSWYRVLGKKNYIIREFRNSIGMYLKRRENQFSKRVRCVVYTKDAYMHDPDMTMGELKSLSRFFRDDDGYVLVAVLGDPDKNTSTVSYSRFVKNLAGANNEYKKMNKADLVDLAQKVDDYRKNYIGVAD